MLKSEALKTLLRTAPPTPPRSREMGVAEEASYPTTTTTRRSPPSATWSSKRCRRCGRRLPQRPLPAVFSSISLSPHCTPQHYSRTAASGVSCVPSFSPLFDFLHKHTFSSRKRIQFYVFQHPRTGLLSFAAPCSKPPLPAVVASISSFRRAALSSPAHRNSCVSHDP